MIITPQRAALIDAGYAFSAGRMVENIRERLKGRPLCCIVLTHSHYDHASGAAACRQAFPGAQVLAGEKAAAVFHRPSALSKMRELDDRAAQGLGMEPDSALLKTLTVDRVLREGELIDLGALCLHTYETPGHTRCSLSFFDETSGLLVASETLGLPMGQGLNKPGYLIGYQLTIDSIRKIQALQPQALLLPHNGLYTAQTPGAYLDSALHWAEKVKGLVVEGYRQGKTQAELVEAFKQLYFYADIGRRQVEEAFMLNAGIMVRMLLRECLGLDA